MNESRIRISLLKAIPVTAGCFIMSIILYAVGSLVDGALIDPVSILLIFALFSLIYIVNVFRTYIDDTPWAKSKPVVIKNVIFAPVYLILALVFASLIIGVVNIPLLILMGVIFLAVFTVMQLIVYHVAKKDTDLMNDALSVFQKEHGWDEQE